MAQERILNILVVDDEAVVRDFLSRFLSLLPIKVKVVEDGQKALEAVKEEVFDLLFLDIRMPGMNGLELFSRIKKINPAVRCVFMTGYASAEEELLAMVKQEGVLCLRKPFDDLNQIKEIAVKALQEVRSSRKQEEQPKEKRTYVRLDTQLDVEYRIEGKDAQVKRCQSRNISLGGIRLLLQEELVSGARLGLVIRNPLQNKSCRVSAEVVWAKKSDAEGYYDAGLKFTEININELSGLISK